MSQPLVPVTPEIAERLAALVPPQARRAPEPRYLEEPRGLYAGRAGLVLAPGSTGEVARLLDAAQALRVPVVPHGGGTGLVGGQVMPAGPAPLVLSLERMAAIRSLDAAGGTAVVEAGVVLADLQAAAEAEGRLFPLSLGSEGSARLGGLLSTNAGGIHVLRYGTARELALGIEAVLPGGRVIRALSRVRKDNTGYDLRHLLIGSEGTLGIITAASLRLFPRPAAMASVLMGVASPAAALRVLGRAQEIMGPGLTAAELISGVGLDFIDEAGLGVPRPFAARPDWSLLLDWEPPRGAQAEEAALALLEAAGEDVAGEATALAASEAQRAGLWALREAIPHANRAVGAVSSHDISVPVGAVPAFIEAAGAAIAALGPFRVNCFGHLGDGNLHYNVFPPCGGRREDWLARREEVQETVFALVAETGGSISAEHGIGRMKVAALERYGDPGKLAAMRAIKAALDPAGIMNPGAVLPAGPVP